MKGAGGYEQSGARTDDSARRRVGSWGVPYETAKRFGYPMRPSTTLTEQVAARLGALEARVTALEAALAERRP